MGKTILYPSVEPLDLPVVTNSLGLNTILGDASPVADRWASFRRPWSVDEDDNTDATTPRRGTAPNVEAPPGTPEYESAMAAVPAAEAAALPSTSTLASTIAVPLAS